MASMSVSLSDQMRGYVKERVQSGSYHNESEYIRDLIRRDQAYREKELSLLLELRRAEESGRSDKSLTDIMAEVEKRRQG